MPAVEGNADGGGKGVLKRLIICTVGIILSFGAWGYLLESLTSGGKRMSETGTILMNGIMFTCVARAVMAMNGKRPSSRAMAKKPSMLFAAISVTYVVGMLLTFRALRFVNFPTQVLAKSCRPIPITIMNVIRGKRYPWQEYVAVLLLCGGVVLFTVGGAKNKQQAENTTYGIIILAISLVLDGATGALEDRVVEELGWKHGEGTFDLMMFINLWSIPTTVIVMVCVGDFSIFEMTTTQLTNLSMLGVAGSFGQVFIFYTLSNFGALVVAMLTTVRKVITITLSVILFGHVFTMPQVAGVSIAFGGLGMSIRNRMQMANTAPPENPKTPKPSVQS